MIRFLGNIEAKTDAKGRVFIPAGFRRQLQSASEEVAITVVATQDTVESDSFDKDYDADAEYPVVAVEMCIIDSL